MYRDKARFGSDPTVVVRSRPPTFNAPVSKVGGLSPADWKWRDGTRVFTCSWSDWFHEAADEWRAEALEIIRRRPGLIFQVLTKRPERIAQCLPPDWGRGYPNVWLGVTAETQETYEERLNLLASVPAAMRFCSLEPLLGPVDLALHGTAPRSWHGTGRWTPVSEFVDWVIVGGESGTFDSSRPCRAEWIRSVVSDCLDAEVPVFVKQLGSQFIDEANGIAGAHLPSGSGRPGVVRLHDAHGANLYEWPEELQVQQVPGMQASPSARQDKS
jgi:protein gp37